MYRKNSFEPYFVCNVFHGKRSIEVYFPEIPECHHMITLRKGM